MGALLAFAVFGIPCVVFVFWCLTPWGKKWRQANGLL